MATLRQIALRWLAQRDYTVAELQRKLQIKDFSSADIHTFLSEARQAGWLNETRYIENYIHMRQQKGYGPLRIQAELRSKGITDENIAQQLDIDDNAWQITITRVWQKYSKGKLPQDLKTRIKHRRFLQYRGFTQEQIDYAIHLSE
ncbi:MAG: hypothetical protein A3E83_03180 [Gammaproteobacteria bacterium RIFCSPHIGHO2_12_FULL_41_20]|nr:MAG: hypothetical protein A3E83_03180 [Gammaproteobacteria bacterium RIFCSPHIGHO2_12_FULL_41_20]